MNLQVEIFLKSRVHCTNRFKAVYQSRQADCSNIYTVIEGQWIYDSDNTTVPDWALPKWGKSKPDIDATKNCAWVRRGNFYRTDSSCNNYEYVICESSMNIPEKKGKEIILN